MGSRIELETINEIGTNGHIDTATDVNGNKTSCLTSCDVIIKSRGCPVGAIQSFNFTENSHASGLINGSCNRIYFDNTGIIEAFTGKLNLPNDPFDIVVEYSNGTFITIKNVAIREVARNYSVNDAVVDETIWFNADKAVSKRPKKPSQKIKLEQYKVAKI